MASLKELKEQRGEAVTAMQELRDIIKKENRDFTAEETERWDKVNKDYDAFCEKIQVLERTDKIDKDLETARQDAEHRAENMTGKLGKNPNGEITEETRALAFQGWANAGNITKEQQDACKRVGLNPNSKEFEFRMPKRIVTLRELEKRALEVGTNNEGGYLVPQGFINQLEMSMLYYGPMLQVAEVMRTATGNTLPWPTADDTGESGELVDEEGAHTADTSTPFGQVSFGAYKLGSKIIKVSGELLTDSAFDLATALAAMIGERLGRGINSYCTSGTGSDQPNGIVTAAGEQETATASTLAADDFIELEHAVDVAYRNPAFNCGFMMHDSIIKAVRKFKDENNQYIWQPSYQAGAPDRLLGWPLYVNNNMDSSVTDDADVALFGALRKYKIRQVQSIKLRRLQELYAGNDQEGFVAFIRFDGDLLDAGTDPIKVLNVKSAAS